MDDRHSGPPDHDDDAVENEALDDEAAEDARLREATAIADQLELFAVIGTPAIEASATRAKFEIADQAFAALANKGTLRRVGREAKDVATLEVLRDCIRWTSHDGPVSLRATLPLDPTTVTVPESGIRFCVNAGGLLAFAELKNHGLPWSANVDLAQNALTLRPHRLGSRKPARRARFTLRAEPPPPDAGFPCGTETAKPLGAFRGDLASRALRLCLAAADQRSMRPYAVVEIENGTARGGCETAVMVVHAAGLQGHRLTVPVPQGARVARVLRHTKAGTTYAYETEHHFLIKDTVVELAIRKSGDRFPATDSFAKAPARTSTPVNLQKLLEWVACRKIDEAAYRAWASRKDGSAHKKGKSAGSRRLSLVEVQRASQDLLGLKFEQPTMVARFYLREVRFEPYAFLDCAHDGEHGAEPDTPADLEPRARQSPEVWGRADAAGLERTCLALTSVGERATLSHLGPCLCMEARNAELTAASYLLFINTRDERFESQISKDGDDDFERIVALFGAQWPDHWHPYIFENKGIFAKEHANTQGFSAPPAELSEPATSIGVEAVDGPHARPPDDGEPIPTLDGADLASETGPPRLVPDARGLETPIDGPERGCDDGG